MIPAFNNAEFLREALLGVMKQCLAPREMQIEVIDDHSDEDLKRTVQEIGRGRVAYYRQERRVGHIANFHTCILRSTGRIIHLLHGDDAVLPGFYERLGSAFDVMPDLGAAFCRQIFVDKHGNRLSVSALEQTRAGPLDDALCRLADQQRIMTPSIVVRRAVYEELGGFDRRLICSEDWEMWVRIASRYSIWYEPEPLALYRLHPNSNTGRHLRSARDMAYTRKAIDIFEAYLPRDRAREIAQGARRVYARSALEAAERLLDLGDYRGFYAQLREGLCLARPLPVLKRAARLLLRYGLRRARIS